MTLMRELTIFGGDYHGRKVAIPEKWPDSAIYQVSILPFRSCVIICHPEYDPQMYDFTTDTYEHVSVGVDGYYYTKNGERFLT